ncbi:NF-kappa-B inhibitor delta isoform X1 [Dendrobates tinctorius]|uniref:NF-kappa-B inhibitor delta isoform X1 n=1 Tax=Dendrobates tinctorius TaxID=92724 RepID=UPI003CC92726
MLSLTAAMIGAEPEKRLMMIHTDCRPYSSPPQTVKQLLEQKRQHNPGQVSASLVDYQPDPGSVGPPSFLHHGSSHQKDDSIVYHRTAPHYTYSPLEDLYVSSSGLMYSHEDRYETGKTDSPAADMDIGVASPGSYMATFAHNPSWMGHGSGTCSTTRADTFLRMSGFVVPDLMPLELEEARSQIQSISPEQLLNHDEDGDTILHLYTARGLRYQSYAVAERFFQYGQLDAKEHNGKSPLLVAVAANQPEIVYDLLTLGADVNASDRKGQTALHVAGTYGLSDVLRMFLPLQQQRNIDVEARNYDGLTPLHCAVISQNNAFKSRKSQNTPTAQQQERETSACIKLLLQMGASCTSQEIKSNKTVLHLAVQDGNVPLVKFFLELSHANLPGLINMKAHGNTALHMAAALQPNRSTEYLIQLLLFYGGDPSIRNLENDQPAHLVPPGEFSEQIKMLLKRRRVMSSNRSQSANSL